MSVVRSDGAAVDARALQHVFVEFEAQPRRVGQDEVAVRGTERFDIKCANLGDATDAGPIVALKL